MRSPTRVDFRILDWRPLRRKALLGFARVELPSGMIIVDVRVFLGDDGPWAAPPSRPMLGSDGVAYRDDAGKMRYQPIIEFTTKAVSERFSDAVIAALQTTYPFAIPVGQQRLL